MEEEENCDEVQNDMAANELGKQLVMRGDYVAASRVFEEAVVTHPTWANRHWRGVTKFYLGDFEAALKDFEVVAEMKPEIVSVKWDYGNTLYHLKKYDMARTVLEQVLDLDNGHEGARAILQLLKQRTKAVSPTPVPRTRLRAIDLFIVLGGIVREQVRNPDGPLFIIEDKDSMMNKWRVMYPLAPEQRAKFQSSVIEVELSFRKENYAEAPSVSIISPRLVSPNIFGGAMCLYELSAEQWGGLSGLNAFLVALREHLVDCELDETNSSRQYQSNEMEEGMIHIAYAHPDWGLEVNGRQSEHVQRAKALLEKGQQLFSLGRYGEALECFRNSHSLLPSMMTVHWRGLSSFHLGDHQSALADFDVVLNNKPNLTSVVWDRSNTLYRLGRFEEAAAALSQVLAAGPHVGATALLDQIKEVMAHSAPHESKMVCIQHQLRAEALYSQGKLAEALVEFDNVVRIIPLSSAVRWRGLVHFHLGDMEAAIEQFDQVLEAYPSMVSAIWDRGNALYRLARFDEARKALSRVLELSPGHSGAQEILSRIKSLSCDTSKEEAIGFIISGQESMEKGQYDSAHMLFTKALESERSWYFLHWRGIASFYQGEFHRAMADFEDAIALHPNEASLLWDKSNTLFRMGKLKEAKDSLLKLLEVDSAHTAAQTLLDVINEKLGGR
eukprot:Sspe_Gene.7933::Locus_2687_Transcript_1_1_Confidence_1.000_Length_2453::g.7933::m.7933